MKADLRVRHWAIGWTAGRKWVMPGFSLSGLGERGLQEWKRSWRSAAEKIDCRSDEELERDHGGNGIARQAENWFVRHKVVRKDRGLSRANRHGVEIKVGAEIFQDVFDQIILAHGDAAGQHQNIFMQARVECWHANFRFGRWHCRE